MHVLLLFVAALIVGSLWYRRYERSARVQGIFSKFKGRKLVLTDAKTAGARPVLCMPRFVVRKGRIGVSFACVGGHCQLISSKIIQVHRVRLATDPFPLQGPPPNRLVTWRFREEI